MCWGPGLLALSPTERISLASNFYPPNELNMFYRYLCDIALQFHIHEIPAVEKSHHVDQKHVLGWTHKKILALHRHFRW